MRDSLPGLPAPMWAPFAFSFAVGHWQWILTFMRVSNIYPKHSAGAQQSSRVSTRHTQAPQPHLNPAALPSSSSCASCSWLLRCLSRGGALGPRSHILRSAPPTHGDVIHVNSPCPCVEVQGTTTFVRYLFLSLSHRQQKTQVTLRHSQDTSAIVIGSHIIRTRRVQSAVQSSPFLIFQEAYKNVPSPGRKLPTARSS